MESFFGFDTGFWYSIAVVCAATIIYNIVFWAFKPKPQPAEGEEVGEKGFFGQTKRPKKDKKE